MKVLKFQSSITCKRNGVLFEYQSNPWYITVFEKTNIEYRFDGPILKQPCCREERFVCCNKPAYLLLLALCNFHL